jgi:hypothetical protein
MALSNTYTYTVNKLTLITDALIEAGVIQDDEAVDGGMHAWMSRRLNGLVKQLQARGLHLWRTVEVTLLLESSKVEYTLGTGGDRCSETVVRGLTTTATAIAAITYDVPSTGMAVSDIVGIEMSDGEMHWDTVATIPDSASITVSTGPTVAAALGAVVYAYTAIIPKPLRIHEAYVIQKANEDSHQPLTVIPREEYMRLNSKITASIPVEIWFNPERTTSMLKIWPTSNNNIQRIVMTAELPMDDMLLSTDNLNFPDWWYEAIHLKLAHIAARSYKAPIEKTNELNRDSMIALLEAENFNVESTYIEMHPDVNWTG